MATTNPVTQVLVTSGNQAPIAAGNRVDSLAVGQVGVFNYHTGLSVGAGSAVGDTRDVFIAVGIDPDGVGSLQDINKSAGQVIQVRNAKSSTIKAYVAALPKIIDITAFKAKCETDYLLKIEFRNQKIYGQNGYNQFNKVFNYTTACCADECDTCAEGDCNELAKGLMDNINADVDRLVIAQLLDYTTTPGTGIVVTDYAAWVADEDNAGKCLGLRLTSQTDPQSKSTGSINMKYYSPRGTDMIISTQDSFSCNATITTFQELQYAEGQGYDLQWQEYLAGGLNGKPGPYRLSTINGVERDGIVFFASKTANYTQLTLSYDQQSVGGWLEYLNNLQTIIAIPCADSTTLTGLVAIFDVIFTQFGAMANDAAGIDCTNLGTSTLTAATDGIESLS